MVVRVLLTLAVLAVPVQTLLCLKCRVRFFKRLPVILSCAFTLVCLVLSFLFREDAWTGAGYFVTGVFSVPVILGCVIGWLIAYCIFRNRALKRMEKDRTSGN